jgi:hypothetical protein
MGDVSAGKTTTEVAVGCATAGKVPTTDTMQQPLAQELQVLE